MKHFKGWPASIRNALAAITILTLIYPVLARTVAHYAANPITTTAAGTIAALILLLRIHPEFGHQILTALKAPAVLAARITGHTPPAPKPEPSYKHSPIGPQIPVNNHTR